MSLRNLVAWSLSLLFITSAIAADPPGKRYALLVGVNDYEHPAINPLNFAENDAEELDKLFRDQKYETKLFSTGGRVPHALPPTKANIETALNSILERCTKRDTVVVALNGHGFQFEGKKDGYFCPADGKPMVNLADKTMVSLGNIYERLDESNAGSKVLLVDACRDDPFKTRGITAENSRPPKGIAALFSCSAGERAIESGRFRHGVFTYHVLEGLKGKASDPDGDVTFAGLAAYVTRRVVRDVGRFSGDESLRQSPNLRADYSQEPLLVDGVGGARNGPPANSGLALVIGVNEYENLQEQLKGADNDASRFAAALRKLGFANDHVTLMNTSEVKESPDYPSAKNIRRELNRIAQVAGPDSVVAVFYAGFERQYAASDEYFIVPADATENDRGTQISHTEIGNILAGSKAKSRLIVIDSCRFREDREKLNPPAKTPKQPPAGIGLWIGCSAGELAFESPKLKGGVFTTFLCQALGGSADRDRDGAVSGDEISRFVRESVPAYAEKDNLVREQHPEFFGKTEAYRFKLQTK